MTKGRTIQKAMDGMSSRKVAREMGVSKDTARRLKRKILTGESLERKKAQKKEEIFPRWRELHQIKRLS